MLQIGSTSKYLGTSAAWTLISHNYLSSIRAAIITPISPKYSLINHNLQPTFIPANY